jgi:hypothetical protein
VTRRQAILILGLAIAGLIVPNFTVGLCLMCAAVGAFLAVAVE